MDNGAQQIPQPAQIINDGTQGEVEKFDFPEAMRRVIDGKVIRKLEWQGDAANDYCLLKDGWLTIYRKGDFHKWFVNDGDLIGEDWTEVK